MAQKCLKIEQLKKKVLPCYACHAQNLWFDSRYRFYPCMEKREALFFFFSPISSFENLPPFITTQPPPKMVLLLYPMLSLTSLPLRIPPLTFYLFPFFLSVSPSHTHSHTKLFMNGNTNIFFDSFLAFNLRRCLLTKKQKKKARTHVGAAYLPISLSLILTSCWTHPSSFLRM
jgi:hypothetical protein